MAEEEQKGKEVMIRLPAVFRSFTKKENMYYEGNTLEEVFKKFISEYKEAKNILYRNDELNRAVNIYLNEEDIRYKEGLETKVRGGDVILIIPAIAGGGGNCDSCILDLRGVECPMNWVKTKLKLEEMREEETIEILIDDMKACTNIMKSAKTEGYKILYVKQENNYFKFGVKK